MRMCVDVSLTDGGDVCVVVFFIAISMYNAGFAHIGVTQDQHFVCCHKIQSHIANCCLRVLCYRWTLVLFLVVSVEQSRSQEVGGGGGGMKVWPWGLKQVSLLFMYLFVVVSRSCFRA